MVCLFLWFSRSFSHSLQPAARFRCCYFSSSYSNVLTFELKVLAFSLSSMWEASLLFFFSTSIKRYCMLCVVWYILFRLVLSFYMIFCASHSPLTYKNMYAKRLIARATHLYIFIRCNFLRSIFYSRAYSLLHLHASFVIHIHKRMGRRRTYINTHIKKRKLEMKHKQLK